MTALAGDRAWSRSRLSPMRALGARLTLAVAISLGLAFLAVPIVSLLFYASPTTLLGKLSGPLARQALVLSLTTTLGALVITVITGTPMAWWLAKHDFPGRRLVDVGLQLTIVLPASVAGLGLLLVFGRSGLLGGALGYARHSGPVHRIGRGAGPGLHRRSAVRVLGSTGVRGRR